MDSAGSDIANFQSVIIQEGVLDSQRPVDGLRILLIYGNECSSGSARTRDVWEDGDAAAGGQDAAAGQEGRGTSKAATRLGAIAGGAQLRRSRQDSQIVEQDVIGDAGAGPDGGASTGARRIGKADARTPIIFCRARLREI